MLGTWRTCISKSDAKTSKQKPVLDVRGIMENPKALRLRICLHGTGGVKEAKRRAAAAHFMVQLDNLHLHAAWVTCDSSASEQSLEWSPL